MEEKWLQDAKCRGVGYTKFYTEKKSGQRNYDDARKICDRCPVRPQCLAFSLISCEEFGFWGGMSPGERADFKRAGTQYKVDWENIVEVASFMRTYPIAFQPTLYNGYKIHDQENRHVRPSIREIFEGYIGRTRDIYDDPE